MRRIKKERIRHGSRRRRHKTGCHLGDRVGDTRIVHRNLLDGAFLQSRLPAGLLLFALAGRLTATLARVAGQHEVLRARQAPTPNECCRHQQGHQYPRDCLPRLHRLQGSISRTNSSDFCFQLLTAARQNSCRRRTHPVGDLPRHFPQKRPNRPSHRHHHRLVLPRLDSSPLVGLFHRASLA